MGECRGGGGDGLIKLFGKTIPVAPDVAKDLQQHSGSSSSSTESDIQETAAAFVGDPSPRSEVVDGDDPATKSPPPQPTTGGGSEAKEKEKEKLKKPDKILPCPRCSSMDTKFCYFNNYNVNQPRHFCKHCQRYWTAGGAMRNVPVGAGRRKNKHAVSASHFLHRAAVRAVAGGVDDLLNTNNGTVLSFGVHDVAPSPPQPLAVDLAGQMTRLNKERLVDGGGSCSEVSSNRDDQNYQSSRNTVAKPAIGLQQHPATMNGWPYNCALSPTYYTSGIAIPIYPAPAPAYWGCMIPPPPGAWSLPWPAAVQSQAISSSSPTSAPSVSSSLPSSLPTLGKKHPREGGDEGMDDDHGSNGKVWVPKTIRIDNADEVARSSIRSLFGFRGGEKEDDDGTTSTHKLATTVFEPKGDAKTAKHRVIASLPLLHTNPVALTRSVTFQEGT